MAILKGPVNPVTTGITTFPELDNIQVATPNRHSVDPSLLLDFSNSKTLDPRVTFTRGSNATFYDGSTVLAEQNLAAYSQEFENAYWTKNGTTISANATAAPDGTTTADLIYPASTGVWRIIYKYLSDANKIYTASFYAKPSGMSWFMVQCDNTSNTSAWFNVTTGSVGAKGSATIISHSMTSVGNGWYRCQMTFNSGSGGYLMCGVSDSDGSSTATASGTNGIFIWGGQLEERSSVTAYTATTTLPITNYVPVLKTAGPNQPRFDVDPITRESKGLLIEEQRTNLHLYSQDLSNGYWTTSGQNLTIRADHGIAPDGTQTADLVIPTTGNSAKYLYATYTKSANVPVTVSLYAKKIGYDYITIQAADNGAGSGYQVGFNLNTGTVGTATLMGSATLQSTSITAVGNGWYRCVVTATSSGTTGWTALNVGGNGGLTLTGDGFAGNLIWGVQVENNALFPTSYIPTVAATATRAIDSAVIMTNTFGFNNAAHTVYAESALIKPTGDVMIAEGTNAFSQFTNFSLTVIGSTGNTQYIDRLITTGNDLRGSNGTVVSNTFFKVAGAGDTTSTAAAVNGVLSSSIGNQNSNALTDRIYIGSRAGSSLALCGWIKKFSIYPVKLTNAEIVSLTIA